MAPTLTLLALMLIVSIPTLVFIPVFIPTFCVKAEPDDERTNAEEIRAHFTDSTTLTSLYRFTDDRIILTKKTQNRSEPRTEDPT
jgi:hypothetical protein